jgi:hypothetical protein
MNIERRIQRLERLWMILDDFYDNSPGERTEKIRVLEEIKKLTEDAANHMKAYENFNINPPRGEWEMKSEFRKAVGDASALVEYLRKHGYDPDNEEDVNYLNGETYDNRIGYHFGDILDMANGGFS